MVTLALAAFVLAGANALMLATLVWRRISLTLSQRRRRRWEEELRPAVLLFLNQDEELPPVLPQAAQEVVADLLARYARVIRGPARQRIAEMFEDSGAVRAQIRLLNSRRAWRRAAAAHRLGEMSSPAAVPALVAALEDRTADVRTAAARSLGRLAAPEAVRPLLGAMSDRRVPEAMVRWALLQGGPEVLPSLRALVNRADPAERAGAVQLLGLLGDAADEPALIARLGDSSAKVRERAARALGRIGSGGAVAGLRRALADRIPAVRAAAAESLGRLGDPSGLEALIMQAGTDSFEPARAAAYAAAQLDPERVAATARVTRAPHLLEAADVVALR